MAFFYLILVIIGVNISFSNNIILFIYVINFITISKLKPNFFSQKKVIFHKLFKGKLFYIASRNWFFKLKQLLSLRKKNLKWRPLFKKSSYYGFYRANQNQWLNK